VAEITRTRQKLHSALEFAINRSCRNLLT